VKEKGLIVSFEGIDGCGKTTQARLFLKYLKKTGTDVILLNEPGGTYAGNKIRKLLLDKKNNISPLCELFLYLASRAQLVGEVIEREIREKTVIILDRYMDSTTAYQGYGREVPVKFIEHIHQMLIGPLMPDITFLIDAPAEKLRHVLKKKNRDRIERESVDFQKRVRNGYLKIAGKHPSRIRIIKKKTLEETHNEVIKEWENFLNGRKGDTEISYKNTRKK
jgi:dTMP kinase